MLMVRETLLHVGRLRTMTRLSEIGAIIMPPVPTFYDKPKTIDEMVNQTVGRILDLFDLDVGMGKCWKEP